MTTIKQHKDGNNLVVDKGIASFPALLKTKFNTLSKKEEFAVDILFPKTTDLSELNRVATKVAQDKWGQKIPTFKYAWLKDGDSAQTKDGEPMEGYVGHWFITAKSEEAKPPVVVDLAGNDITRVDGIIGGDIIDAFISCYAYSHGNNGISFGLNTVRLREKAAVPFGGGVSHTTAKEALSELDVDDMSI